MKDVTVSGNGHIPLVQNSYFFIFIYAGVYLPDALGCRQMNRKLALYTPLFFLLFINYHNVNGGKFKGYVGTQ